jgi:hypothetical protein
VRRFRVIVGFGAGTPNFEEEIQASTIDIAIGRGVTKAGGKLRGSAGRAPNDFYSVTPRDLGAIKYEWRVAKSFWEPSGLGKVHREVSVGASFYRRGRRGTRDSHRGVSAI